MNRTKEMSIEASPADAADRAERALEAIGKKKKRTEDYMTGRIRYGLQSVEIRISWSQGDTGVTRIVLQGSSDDVWGKGAESALDRLETTIRNIDVPGYKPDRLGMHPAALVGLLILFVLVVLWFVGVL